jgi:hypothetical protein
MRGWGRFYLIAVLLIAAIVLITSGTMAFYTQSHTLRAALTTAQFALKVNESTRETQTLSDMTLSPGDSRTRQIKIDTSGIEVPAKLTVTLAVHANGALPPGFSASLDGVAATGANPVAVQTVDPAEKKTLFMDVLVSWTVSGDEDLEQYRDLAITYEVTVTADQKAGV